MDLPAQAGRYFGAARMSGLLGNLIFLNPWILAALGALPVLWYLLRITPPAAKHIVLPSIRFVRGLVSERQTPSHTPWWILLLRLMIAALVILALAHPVHNPAQSLPNAGAVRIVIDNGWEAAQTWQQQMQAAREIVAKAGRESREIYIMTTSANAGKDAPQAHGPLVQAQAESILEGLKPNPWESDYLEASRLLKETRQGKGAYSFWFSSGLENTGFKEFASTLQSQGGLSYFRPEAADLPLALKEPKTSQLSAAVDILRPRLSPPGRMVSVQAIGSGGRVLDQKSVTLNDEKIRETIEFDIPETLRGDVARYKIAGTGGPGGTYILDESLEKKTVGLYQAAEQADPKPFIEARYYLQRALEPFATLKEGSVEELIDDGVSAIILADVATMSPATLERLENWVREGGLLLRFAGPNMAQIGLQNFLTPVPLQTGERSLEGSLTWETPPKLAEFPPSSPLNGIRIHEDLVVRQQILASPTEFLEERSWAKLDDGTPIITADALEDGLLVMVHTSATPDWSDIPLSGVFVDILKRIISLAGTSASQIAGASGTLQPIWVLDGFGRQSAPDVSVLPIPAKDADAVKVGPSNPPGLYGSASYQKALNIGTHLTTLKAAEDLPAGVTSETYGQEYEQDLLPYLLFASLAFLLLDWFAMLMMSLSFRFQGKAVHLSWIAALILLTSTPAQAAEVSAKDLQYASGLYLAFISSGNASIDQTTKEGLEALSDVLSRRTSVEPDGVAMLDPETDELAFFPLIYWPISDNPVKLSPKAIEKVQYYLGHGGTILFDTRDQGQSTGRLQETQNARSLRLMLNAFSLPALEPIPKDHVLAKSFYLLDSFPGRYTDGAIWVEAQSSNGRDGVSSVIIGPNDWAGIWATSSQNRAGIRGGARQQEMSYRFGVNLVMYALTGNYKADQVHVPHILERLGQ